MTDDFDLPLRSFAELVYDQVRVVSTKVVEEDWDSETDWTFQVAMSMSGAEKESRDVIVVSDLWPFQIVFLEWVSANVALRRVLVLLPFLSAHSLYR